MHLLALTTLSLSLLSFTSASAITPRATKCGLNGVCKLTSQCTGNNDRIPGLCPGAADIQCCEPKIVTKGKNLGQQILEKAEQVKGIKYVFGGGDCAGPTGGGFDCSGLVSWAVCQVTKRNLFAEGLRVTYDMYCASEKELAPYTKIPYKDRRAGDAVFFGGACDCATDKEGIHHVGLMMNSGTDMWDALETGTTVGENNFAGWTGTNKPCPFVVRFNPK